MESLGSKLHARRHVTRWRRYFTVRARHLSTAVREVLSFDALEKTILVRVDDTLRSLDERVQERLAAIAATSKRARSARAKTKKAVATAKPRRGTKKRRPPKAPALAGASS